MFKTGEEAYEYRRGTWAERQAREAREAQERQRAGEGVTRPLSRVPEIDRYMFDLNGCARSQPALLLWLLCYTCSSFLTRNVVLSRVDFIIKGAVSPEQLAEYNAQVDANNPMPGIALGITPNEAQAMMNDPHSPELKDLQQGFGDGIPALGTHPCFDSLIDHPSWISHIRCFTNGMDTRMTGGGGVSCRWPGQASGIHGGGHNHNQTFGWIDPEEDEDTEMVLDPGRPGGDQMVPKPKTGLDGEPGGGRFHCKTVSVLLALNDCPLGGGGTAVIPGSHKSNIRHPYQDPDGGHPQLLWRSQEPYQRRHGKSVLEGGYMDGVPGAVELAVEAGDALLLVESCVHGSCVRTLPGCRKTILLRYGPNPDTGWKAPAQVLERLSPEARALISPEPAETEEPQRDEKGKVVLDHHGKARPKL